MKPVDQPRVSVVIPVYNGQRLIANAIRSVQSQTYQNWDLTIGNNRSTDGTLAIAEEFAASDPRIRVVTYEKHVNVVESHNTAFNLMAPEAKYVKILGSDDWFFPNCLEELVKVAEAHPTAGMVGSYFLSGRRPHGLALPYPSTCMPGREFLRLRLLTGMKGTGSPSVSMIRADVVRQKQPFYNPLNYAGDVEAYLDLLQEHDLGFVHQVLTCLRNDEESRTTSYLERVDSYYTVDLDEVTKFGRAVLTEAEYTTRLKQVTDAYYKMLGAAVFPPRPKEFWDYHFRHVKAMGYTFNKGRIAWEAFLRALDQIGNPKRTFESILERLAARSEADAPPKPVQAPPARVADETK